MTLGMGNYDVSEGLICQTGGIHEQIRRIRRDSFLRAI